LSVAFTSASRSVGVALDQPLADSGGLATEDLEDLRRTASEHVEGG
jgi:hypothetical protein